MKKPVLFISFLFLLQLSYSQVRFGLRGGLSNSNEDGQMIQVFTPADSLQLGITDAKYGIHLGIYAQFKGKHFFVQPEVLFNSSSVEYQLSDFRSSDVVNELLSETYQQLDIPVMMGLRAGPFRIGAGPVGHLFLNSNSDLEDLDNFEPLFKRMKYGMQAGLGLDIGKVALDVKWEGNFYKFGDHIQFSGESFKFDKQSTRLIASLGIAF